MSDTPASPQDPISTPKILGLDISLSKTRVETSLGALYVRPPSEVDWESLGINGEEENGRAAVCLLSSRIEDELDSQPLASEDLGALVSTDLLALSSAIAHVSGLKDFPVGGGLTELGRGINDAKERQQQMHRKMLADMRQSIESSYGFLAPETLNKLQQQMAGLADIRKAMPGTEALEAALGTSGIGKLKDAFPTMDIGHDTPGMVALGDLQRQMADIKHVMPGTEALQAALGITKPIGDMWKREIVGMESLKSASEFKSGMEERPQVTRLTDLTPLLRPQPPEETPIGRATLKSEEHSREVAQKMVALVDVVAGLNQTLVKDILPAWFQQIEAEERSAKEAFQQAASSLRWTKWAVIASVIVTALATWWQVSVAREIDQENSEQQRRLESILRDQLSVQQQLAAQRAPLSKVQKDSAEKMKATSSVGHPSK